jgi:hypothetical protein
MYVPVKFLPADNCTAESQFQKRNIRTMADFLVWGLKKEKNYDKPLIKITGTSVETLSDYLANICLFAVCV